MCIINKIDEIITDDRQFRMISSWKLVIEKHNVINRTRGVS